MLNPSLGGSLVNRWHNWTQTTNGAIFFTVCILIINIYVKELDKSFNGIDVSTIFISFLSVLFLSIFPFLSIRKIKKNSKFYFGQEIIDALKRGLLFLREPLIVFAAMVIGSFVNDFKSPLSRIYFFLIVAWSFAAISMGSYLYYREYKVRLSGTNCTEIEIQTLQNQEVKESPTYIDGGKPIYVRRSRALIFLGICISLLFQRNKYSSSEEEIISLISCCLLLMVLLLALPLQDFRRINNYSPISTEEKGERWKKLCFLLRGPFTSFSLLVFISLLNYLSAIEGHIHFLLTASVLSAVSMMIGTVIYLVGFRPKIKEFKES